MVNRVLALPVGLRRGVLAYVGLQAKLCDT